MTHVHFMGIGGSGISGVARMARESGFEVSGCDLEENSLTYRLRKDGIAVAIGHDQLHLKNIGILAHTPAVFYQSETHPEFVKAQKKGIALTWEEFMAKYLQKGKHVICIAGTHGKGHVTAMVSLILEQANLDPTCEIGANLLDWDKRNYRIGKGKFFVCEADEYREKFLIYKPDLAIITSVEMDHPDYFKNFDAVLKAFVKFASKAKTLVINKDDQGCLKLLKELKRLKFGGKIVTFKKLTKSQAKLQLPGDHVRSDSAAAWAAAKTLGVKDKVTRKALESFSGLERRFEYKGEFAGTKLFDDYAHHPTAVLANIKAARELFPKKRLVVVFQPHMYSRLATLFDDFVRVLKEADKVVVADVYSKREHGLNRPTAKELALKIAAPKATYVGGDLQNVANFVERNAQKNDVVILMGAGDITKVSDLLLRKSQ